MPGSALNAEEGSGDRKQCGAWFGPSGILLWLPKVTKTSGNKEFAFSLELGGGNGSGPIYVYFNAHLKMVKLLNFVF